MYVPYCDISANVITRLHCTKLICDVVVVFKSLLLYVHCVRIYFACPIYSSNNLKAMENEHLLEIASFKRCLRSSRVLFLLNHDFFLTYIVLTCIIIPHASTKLKGGYTGITLSVCLSVCPSVDRIVSALYLQQYS